MSNPATSLPPGFRFHPTDEELILHYLRNRAASTPCPASIIAEVDIYKFDPWDLPGKAMFGDKEWYFFSPRDRKYPNGVRPNRAAGSGYWKATGTDKPIMDSRNEINVGVKKALVFYKGRPPKGIKTNWIMHEYRLTDITNRYKPLKLTDHSMRLDDWVLCRIYKKSNSLSLVAVHPLITDQEQEEYSGSELNTNDLPPLEGVPQEDALKTATMTITKSWSISEFLEDYSALSHLYDTQPELPDFTSAPANNPISSSNILFIDGNENENGISHCHSSVTHRMGAESPAAVTVRYSNPLKRQRSGGEQGFSRQASKISLNQFDAPQYKFFDQQGLLNYHFGLL